MAQHRRPKQIQKNTQNTTTYKTTQRHKTRKTYELPEKLPCEKHYKEKIRLRLRTHGPEPTGLWARAQSADKNLQENIKTQLGKKHGARHCMSLFVIVMLLLTKLSPSHQQQPASCCYQQQPASCFDPPRLNLNHFGP